MRLVRCWTGRRLLAVIFSRPVFRPRWQRPRRVWDGSNLPRTGNNHFLSESTAFWGVCAMKRIILARGIGAVIVLTVMAGFVGQASAGLREYCDSYARDVASRKTNGGADVGAI